MQIRPNFFQNFPQKLLKIKRFENNASPKFLKTSFLLKVYPNSGANFTLLAAHLGNINFFNTHIVLSQEVEVLFSSEEEAKVNANQKLTSATSLVQTCRGEVEGVRMFGTSAV